MNKVNTIFLGSGEFAVPVLDALSKLDFINLRVVITQPDKPVGRKQELTPTPVGQYLTENKGEVEILKPEKIRLVANDILEKYKPELIIVAAYGQIIPDSILNYPKYGALNFHGSILPLLRGAVPVPMAILQGFSETGVTMQKMVQKMDEGAVIRIKNLELRMDETTESLMMKLADLAVEMINEDLKKWVDGKLQPVEQDHSKATYCYKEDIAKEKAEIRFETDVDLAERMVRAFYPWPIAWVKIDGKILKIFKARKLGTYESKGDGLKLVSHSKKLVLELANGSLELEEVQLEGKKRDSARNYLYLVK